MSMKRAATLAILVLALSARAAAQSGCAGAIAQFRAVDNDVKIGHLNKSVHNRIVPDLGRVEASCRAGNDAQATRALAALKSRFGYR